MSTTARSIAVITVATMLAACGGSESGSSDDSSVSGRVAVFAASSLTDAFSDIGRAFVDVHPSADVVLNFGGSSRLAAQINEGAPADVFAAADPASMARVVEASDSTDRPVNVATNTSQIIVESGNPLGLETLDDLADPGLVVVFCAPQVPCGSYAAQVLDAAGVDVTPASLEQNVKAVTTKVTSGEADAGIVYVTDVRAAGDAADGVTIPADVNVTATYPIVVTADASNPVGGAAFVDFVRSRAGQDILERYGFGPP